MIPLLLGCAVLAGLWYMSGAYTRADPKALAALARRAGGWAAIGVALLLLMRGRLDMAVFVAMGGAWLLGWSNRLPGALGRFAGAVPWMGAKPATASRMRAAAVEMELDPRSGALGGTVLVGPHAGRPLDALSVPVVAALRQACLTGDPAGARLLEAYLDRRAPGWREHAQADGDPRAGGAAKPGAMTEEEAYEVLGLLRGASAEEVRRAHRALMKRLHPDQGGTDYLAARVNAAKDVLLNRHR